MNDAMHAVGSRSVMPTSDSSGDPQTNFTATEYISLLSFRRSLQGAVGKKRRAEHAESESLSHEDSQSQLEPFVKFLWARRNSTPLLPAGCAVTPSSASARESLRTATISQRHQQG
jgi:hypothetical protein